MRIRPLPSLLLLGLLFAVLGPNAGAVVRRDDQSDSLYQQLAKKAAFNGVGKVEIDYGQGFTAIGTATLIGRDRVVSAAHVFDSSALDGAVGVRMNFGKGVYRTIDFGTAGVVNINPGYDTTTLRNDVSVAFLSKPFNLTPAKVYTGSRISLGTKITFVGYGNTGTGLTGSGTFSITKRAGENALGQYVMGGASYEVDFDRSGTTKYNSLGSSIPLKLEGLLGPGDSGGSAWVYRNKQWQIVGINSYGLDWYPNGNGDGIEDNYGDRSGFAYLPRYSNWIKSLKTPGLTASIQGRSLGLSAVPEPGTVALLGIGGSLMLVLRRRRIC